MKRYRLTPRFVDTIPERLENEVLYISGRYSTAAHKCCCGCNEEVITPITKTDWSLYVDNGHVSLYPSIGNWSFACRSHYWIRRNKVIWAGRMTQQLIDQGRANDRIAKKIYFEEVNRNKGFPPQPHPNQRPSQTEPPSLLYRLWLAFNQWLNS